MKKQIWLLLLLLGLISCKENKPAETSLKELSPENLFEKFHKQVVLISSKNYYEVTFADGTKAYYNEASDSTDIDLVFDKQTAIDNAEVSYGTGFFISNKGIIATNFHVVANLSHLLETTDFKAGVKANLHNEQAYAISEISYNALLLKKYHPEDSAYLAKIPTEYMNSQDGEAYAEEYEPELPKEDSISANIIQRIDMLLAKKEKLDKLAAQDFDVKIETVDLKIQLDASTGNIGTYPCHIYSLSQDKRIDLALIQTDNEKIPKGVGDVTDLFDDNDKEVYGTTIGDHDTVNVTMPLFMIGYNYGPEIAQTNDGIKVQLTKGEVSQECDAYRVLYSVPTLPGSSGSPVFNSKGKIVAINYCGVNARNNFNYGVMSSHLKEMIENKPLLTLPL